MKTVFQAFNLFKSFLQFNPGLRLLGDIYCGPNKFQDRVQNAGWRNPPVQDWGKTFSPHLGALSFVGQLFEILRLPDGTIKYQHSIGRPIVNEKGDLIR